MGSALAPLFDTILNQSDKCDDVIAVIASLLGRMLRPDFVFDAADAFMATVYLIQFLSADPLGEIAAGPVVGYLAQVWRDILADQTFSVRNPVVTGPFILKAPSRGVGSRARLANIVLASEAAVRAHLSDERLAGIACVAPSVGPLRLNPNPMKNQHSCRPRRRAVSVCCLRRSRHHARAWAWSTYDAGDGRLFRSDGYPHLLACCAG